MIRGAFRGAVSHIGFAVGVLAGIWTAGWVSQWVGAHWHGARPAVVFWTLKWLVATLAGLALLAFAQWGGERIRDTLKEGPLGWLDRFAGLAAGALLGAAIATVLVLAAVRLTERRDIARAFASSRWSTPALVQGGVVCERWGTIIPSGAWLHSQFALAVHRLDGIRSSGSRSRSRGSSPEPDVK